MVESDSESSSSSASSDSSSTSTSGSGSASCSGSDSKSSAESVIEAQASRQSNNKSGERGGEQNSDNDKTEELYNEETETEAQVEDATAELSNSSPIVSPAAETFGTMDAPPTEPPSSVEVQTVTESEADVSVLEEGELDQVDIVETERSLRRSQENLRSRSNSSNRRRRSRTRETSSERRRSSSIEKRRTRSRSRSTEKRRSRTRSRSTEKRRSRTRSRSTEKRRSRTRSRSTEKRRSRTRSRSTKRSSRTRSPIRRSRTRSPIRRIRTRSPIRRSRTRSPIRRSRTRSPIRRSRTRSPNRKRRRSQGRSRTPRPESLERRREERKRRHAQRDKRENAKRARRASRSPRRVGYRSPRRENSRSPRRRRTSPKGAGRDKADNVALDNATVTDPKAKITERQRRTVDLLTSRTGGAYIPPAKLRMMQAEITDKASAAFQRIAWEALKKSIHGYINKVNVDNIAIITRELLKENIVRGRGLLCRSIIQAQAASPTFTHVYAALVSIINSKFPKIGELLLTRLVIQFKRAFRRNDKAVCLSSSRFVAHLANQRVAHEILALEVLTLLVDTPTDDSVEVAIAFLKECGMKLSEVSSKGIGAIFEMLKNILHEGKLDKRVQYMIEVVFQVRKDGFKDHPSVPESLDLVEEDDQFTHLLMLDDASDNEDVLNVFKFDEKYAENEGKYKGLCREILGSGSSEDGSAASKSGSESGSDDSAEEDGEDEKATVGEIIDNTETNLIALRRTIYLTINSSLDYEECAHKLVKMQLKPGQEIELCHMFLDCCAEQRTYEKFYGLLAQRFCTINKIYIEPFEEIFRDTYHTTHRLDTNRLRNVSKFFAHLLFTDAISWDVLECIKLNEDDTTSSSRIFVKILFQELAEYMGLSKLNSKLKEDVLVASLAGLFPKDNPRNTRFSINFFTSIGLGGLTDDLRRFLKNAPKVVPAINEELVAIKPIKVESSAESSASSSSSTSSSDSSSESEASSSSSSESESSDSEPKRKRKKVAKQKKKLEKVKTKKAKKQKEKEKEKKKEKKKEKQREKEKEKRKDKKNKKAQQKQKKAKDKKKRRKESSSSSSSSSESSSDSTSSQDSSSTNNSSADEKSSKRKSHIESKPKRSKTRSEHDNFDLSGPLADRRQPQLNGNSNGKVSKRRSDREERSTRSDHPLRERRDERRERDDVQRRREHNDRDGRDNSRRDRREDPEREHPDRRSNRKYHDVDYNDKSPRGERRRARIEDDRRRERRDVTSDDKSRRHRRDNRRHESRSTSKERG